MPGVTFKLVDALLVICIILLLVCKPSSIASSRLEGGMSSSALSELSLGAISSCRGVASGEVTGVVSGVVSGVVFLAK